MHSAMTAPTIKRFYTDVSVAKGDGAWQVLLDEKPVKTYKHRPLALPGAALAEAVAQEWRAQGETIQKQSMPLMRLSSVAIDVVPDDKSVLLDDMLAFAETDLLCYRAEEKTLAEKQRVCFDPVIAWIENRFGVTLKLACGIMPVAQPAENAERFSHFLQTLDPFAFAGVSACTHLSGSLFLALALYEKFLTAQQVASASRLDDTHQAEAWGETEIYVQKQDEMMQELESYQRFFVLLQG